MESRILVLILALLASLSLTNSQITPNISTSNLPTRQLTITGAQISTDAYIDGGLFAQKLFPLDDTLFETPEIALLCYSPWVSPQNWSMFAHLPTVDTPIAWYYPLNYNLGEWKYEYGDTAVCQLWECDSGPGGCDPNNPTALPNSAAGDDLLGQASFNLGSFAILGTAFLNMTVPQEGKGRFGADAGSVLLGCPGCRELLRDNPSWVNPYSAPSDTSPVSASPPPAPPVMSTPPPVASPSPPPSVPPIDSYDGPPQTEDPSLVVPPINITPPPAPSPPIPSPPPVEDGPTAPLPKDNTQQDNETELPPEPQPVTSAKKITKTTLVTVLAVLGAIIGIVLLTALGYCLARRRWKPVQPSVPPPAAAAPQKTKRKPSTRQLRIRVQRPADAESAMRQHRVEGAIAELPWAPKTNV
jgi:hypothetical protein